MGLVNEDADGNGDLTMVNHRFPGQYYDQESGLSYNYFRDYDPATGRYLQSDPRGVILDFSDPQQLIAAQMGAPIPVFTKSGINYLYGYSLQNPIGYIDPTGEFTPIAGAVGGAIAGGAGSFLGTLAAGRTLGDAGSAAVDGALISIVVLLFKGL